MCWLQLLGREGPARAAAKRRTSRKHLTLAHKGLTHIDNKNEILLLFDRGLDFVGNEVRDGETGLVTSTKWILLDVLFEHYKVV